MMAIQRNITLTTMKKCFKAVYGTPIHSYVKDYRIHAATDRIVHRRDFREGRLFKSEQVYGIVQATDGLHTACL